MNSKIKVSDIVIEELKKNGVDTVFGVTGGAVVHFFDSIEKIDGIKSVFLNHEQSASFALEAYAKVRRSIGAGIFTTGPGGTNALTGLVAAWADSTPCIFISGQVRTNQTIHGRSLRQVGTQEIDIISMVKSVTKYAVTVYEVDKVKYHIQKAIYLATHGRPGPVWVDIPVDISWTFVEPSSMTEFVPESDLGAPAPLPVDLAQISRVAELIRCAHRPLVVVGAGVRLSHAEQKLIEFLEKHQLPFVATWNVCDFVPSDHSLNMGRPGLSGQRGANLALQNSDLLISIGSHLNATIVGTRPEMFARDAKIVMVDIDANELEHCPVGLEEAVNTSVGEFLESLMANLSDWCPSDKQTKNWSNHCAKYKNLNRIAVDYKNNREKVNSYYFKYVLSSLSNPGDLYVVDGGGTIVYSSFQSIELKENQRIILSTGLCSMGSGLPEAIGTSFAYPGRRIFCFVGDGSLPFNMQELQVIKNFELPVKVFVFNNEGYVSIRTTQNDFLAGKEVGSSPSSGLCLPESKNVAEAFGLPYFRIENQENLLGELERLMNCEGPFVCEVMVSPKQEIVPRQGFLPRADGTFEPRPIEDMYPFLDRELFRTLMITPEAEVVKASPSGRELDLMAKYPRARRSLEPRARRKQARSGYVGLDEYGNLSNDAVFDQLVRESSLNFGESYFDGSRDQGYGGYRYDPRFWQGVARDIATHYNLKAGSRILEIGCAKGFLLHDLQQAVPGVEVFGLDCSEYAVSNALVTVKDRINVGDARSLQYPDGFFDLVLAINTLSELSLDGCRAALHEIMRATKGPAFITLNSWRNERERHRLLKWNLTALSNQSVAEWKAFLKSESYTGDYYWFFAN
jgi:acetolactate synthase-1/2/3 large subunit